MRAGEIGFRFKDVYIGLRRVVRVEFGPRNIRFRVVQVCVKMIFINGIQSSNHCVFNASMLRVLVCHDFNTFRSLGGKLQ